MATKTLTLRNMPAPLIDAIVDLALAEDRTPTAQAERLFREALTTHGYWPPRSEEGEATPLTAGSSDPRGPGAAA